MVYSTSWKHGLGLHVWQAVQDYCNQDKKVYSRIKFRKLPKENTYADQLKIVLLLNTNTQLAQTAYVITVQAKRIYIIMIKVNNFFFSWKIF